jgi:hypothetical protein
VVAVEEEREVSVVLEVVVVVKLLMVWRCNS